MRRLFDVFERRDHNVAEERNDFDQFEDAIDAGEGNALLVVHLVDVAFLAVHQVKAEADHLVGIGEIR